MDWGAFYRNTAWELVKSLPSFLVIAWPILLLVALIHLAKFIFRTYEQRRLSRSGIAQIDRMDGQTFENYLGTLFVRLGYRVEVTPYVGDFGGDLVTRKDGVKTVIQAKRHQKNVGVTAVQEAVAAKKFYQCTAAMVVTNSHFTRPAADLAKANGVVLWDRERLIEALLSVSSVQSENVASAQVDLPHSADPEAPDFPPHAAPEAATTCATCGKQVTEKVRDFCQTHPERFSGLIYCYAHQRPSRRAAGTAATSEPLRGNVPGGR